MTATSTAKRWGIRSFGSRGFRRIATRYDKLDAIPLPLIQVALNFDALQLL